MDYASLKTSLRATKDKQWGHMRPTGRQFDMSGLNNNLGRLLPEVHSQIYAVNVRIISSLYAQKLII